MLNSTYTVTGIVLDENTVKLDEPIPLDTTQTHTKKVRITIEPLDTPTPNRYQEVMAEIRKRQKARNHQAPSPADIEEYLRKERDSWE